MIKNPTVVIEKSYTEEYPFLKKLYLMYISLLVLVQLFRLLKFPVSALNNNSDSWILYPLYPLFNILTNKS